MDRPHRRPAGPALASGTPVTTVNIIEARDLVLSFGETPALHKLISSGAFDSAQVPFNVLNPSPAEALPAAYPAQDYGRILDLAEKHGAGTIGIRTEVIGSSWPVGRIGAGRSDASMCPPRDRTNACSSACSSSRTLPGHE